MTKNLKLIALAISIIIFFLYLGLLNKYWAPDSDSAIHIVLSKSLLSGKGFTYLGYPYLKYPFGFPVLIAPVIFMFDTNIFILNAYMLLFTFASIFITYLLFRSSYSMSYAIFMSSISGISFLFLSQSLYIMSDVPYMLFSLTTIFFIKKYINKTNKIQHGILAAIMLVISYFIRTIGISILFAFLLFILFGKIPLKVGFYRIKKVWPFFILILFPILLWNIRNATVQLDPNDLLWKTGDFVPYNQEITRLRYDQPSTKISLNDIPKRMAKNGAYYAGVTSSIVLGRYINNSMENLKRFPKAFLILLAVISFFVIMGFCINIFNRRNFHDFYVLFYMLIYLIWPARDTRFLLPILPFLLHYFIAFLKLASKKIFFNKQSASNLAVYIFSIYFIAANLYADIGIIKRQHKEPYYSTEIQEYFDLIRWARNNVAKDKRIVSMEGAWLTCFAKRWCCSFLWVDDQKTILRLIKSVNADYIIVWPDPWQKYKLIIPTIINNPEFFKKIFNIGESVVYIVDKNLLERKQSIIGTSRSLFAS